MYPALFHYHFSAFRSQVFHLFIFFVCFFSSFFFVRNDCACDDVRILFHETKLSFDLSYVQGFQESRLLLLECLFHHGKIFKNWHHVQKYQCPSILVMTQSKITWNLSFSIHIDQPISSQHHIYALCYAECLSLYTLFIMTSIFTNTPKIEFSLKDI